MFEFENPNNPSPKGFQVSGSPFGSVGMKSCQPQAVIVPFGLLFKHPIGGWLCLVCRVKKKRVLAVSVFGGMENLTKGVNNMNISDSSNKKNRIQVSNTKKPLFFYVNLAKVLYLLILVFCLKWLLMGVQERKEKRVLGPVWLLFSKDVLDVLCFLNLVFFFFLCYLCFQNKKSR